eukprot:GFUD01020012.1.p1 GENE.GFUD01020012.1~~GFUD01020012.1.p1  ORF type:complete len:582 (-),score=147.32 GFUD01020012.1:33-1778(-)
MRIYSKSKFDMEGGGESACCGVCFCSKLQKKICCFLIWFPVFIILILLAVVLIKGLTVQDRFERMTLLKEEVVLLNPDNETKIAWANKLGGAIKFPTVSRSETDQNVEEISKLHDYLKTVFPVVFTLENVQTFYPNSLSILLRIQGSKESGNPYLLSTHLDVVPAGDLEMWELDPFLGEIVEQEDEQFVYGRGAIDMKHSVVGILQALEILLNNNGKPERTLYVSFGHDEEVLGHNGAGEIAKVLERLLEENNEKLDFLLDEGMFVMQGVVPGVDDPVIYIGVVEKGWTTLELTVNGDQSHSSVPSRESAIGILAKAVANLEKHRSPAKFSSGPEYDTMSYLAPHASFLFKMVFSNLWLFKDAVSSVFSSRPELDAIQRTTTAVTIINAGFKENVIPSFAMATVNHRIHPTEDLDDILKHDKDVIDDDRVIIKSKEYFPPAPISPYSNDAIAFQIIANSALEVFPTAHVTPGTLMANTDSKHYLHLTDKIYRFTPAFITRNDTKRIHGFNERIAVNNFVQVVEFYYRIIRNADSQVEPFDSDMPGEGSGHCDADEEGCHKKDNKEVKDEVVDDYELIEDSI